MGEEYNSGVEIDEEVPAIQKQFNLVWAELKHRIRQGKICFSSQSFNLRNHADQTIINSGLSYHKSKKNSSYLQYQYLLFSEIKATPIPGTNFIAVDGPKNKEILNTFFANLVFNPKITTPITKIIALVYKMQLIVDSEQSISPKDADCLAYFSSTPYETKHYSVSSKLKDEGEECKGERTIYYGSPFNSELTITPKEKIEEPKKVELSSYPVEDNSFINIDEDKNVEQLWEDYLDYRTKATAVHCNAGAGRTGYLILIFTLVQYYELVFVSDPSQAADNIQIWVDYLRIFRPGLVNTTEQYQQAVLQAMQLRVYQEYLKKKDPTYKIPSFQCNPALQAQGYKIEDLFNPQAREETLAKAREYLRRITLPAVTEIRNAQDSEEKQIEPLSPVSDKQLTSVSGLKDPDLNLKRNDANSGLLLTTNEQTSNQDQGNKEQNDSKQNIKEDDNQDKIFVITPAYQAMFNKVMQLFQNVVEKVRSRTRNSQYAFREGDQPDQTIQSPQQQSESSSLSSQEGKSVVGQQNDTKIKPPPAIQFFRERLEKLDNKVHPSKVKAVTDNWPKPRSKS